MGVEETEKAIQAAKRAQQEWSQVTAKVMSILSKRCWDVYDRSIPVQPWVYLTTYFIVTHL